MTTTSPLRFAARPGGLLRLFALVALAQMPLAPQATALTPPQDAVHHGWDFPKDGGYQSDQEFIANGRVYYPLFMPGYSGTYGIRARDFNGELVFEHLDSQTLLGRRRIGVSSDGRIYFLKPTPSGARVFILGADGSPSGSFGPNGATSEFATNNISHIAIAVSPVSGRVYISDQYGNGAVQNPAKKGLVRVFDRDGNHLHDIQTAGILASTLEGYVEALCVGVSKDGSDQLFVVDGEGYNYAGTWYARLNLKVFRGDGEFLRVFPPLADIFAGDIIVSKDLLFLSTVRNGSDRIRVYPVSASNWTNPLATIPLDGRPLGFNDKGELIVRDGALRTYSYPNYATFDSTSRDAVPNPWVLNVTQRPGAGIVDIDYRVDDSDDETHTTALIAFANGTASLSNVLRLNTLLEGTASNIGAARPQGQVQRVTWNAGSDWNVDFGTLRVMALARDGRDKWFDVHLVEIPADGIRPAVTIHRTVLTQEDFLVQFLWLVATNDPTVNLVDGVLFGTSGAYDGVILANGVNSTPAGRAFLLARDGLRVATAAEVTRAREGATPGHVVSLTPPLQLLRPSTSPYPVSPGQINEFGIEVGQTAGDAQGRWYVVRETEN